MIFQMPASRKNAATRIADTALRTLFHAGNSRGRALKRACAILSSMLDILPLLRACPAAAVALFLSMPAGAEPADLVLENARVYTGNDKQPTASAVAVKGARIVWVGDDAKAFIGSKTRRIDAQGQAV